MKETIWKFPIEIKDYQTVKMPKGTKILALKTQFGLPCIWAMVEDKAEAELRHFRILGTGKNIDKPDLLEYIDTFLIEHDELVFHLFEHKQV